MSAERASLLALKRLISQAEMVYSDRAVPAAQRARGAELFTAALALIDDLLNQDHSSAAAELGAKGGSQTAKRGSEYFRELAAKRKTNAGGRPRKKSL
jgi:hypothetical protein